MPLPSGTRLGPYEIAGPLGAGGMGEVYRARDTRLERTVAIKILPESFASDRERLERFQQEARILSALNHPNLMAIYDVGSQDGMHFLVSEFLEGQTLRERLAAGPLTQRRAIDYGLQIAKGLAAAHEKGIVHRDLKPENIFVLRDERVKILDFGLAKQAAIAAATDGTMTSANRTMPGTVLGTAGYMSPEQVRGEAVDHRSDIFSFGTILYEMLAGQRAFHGDSSVEVMNSILKQDPPELAESGLNVSLGLQRIVQRCLEKRPDARFQSASDLAFALDSLSSTGTSSAGLRALKDTKKTRSRILLPASLLAALAIGALAAYLLHPAASHPDVHPDQLSLRLLSPRALRSRWPHRRLRRHHRRQAYRAFFHAYRYRRGAIAQYPGQHLECFVHWRIGGLAEYSVRSEIHSYRTAGPRAARRRFHSRDARRRDRRRLGARRLRVGRQPQSWRPLPA